MGLRRILKTIATMKNLFKKMMLVAVAAMAFVACSQDNDEINATVKKTDVVFNLSIEDVTRAYFGEEQGSGSDTSFPSYWSGNENVTLVAYDTKDAVLSTAWGSIEAEGEQATQARVSATFEGDLAGVAKVRAYVGSWGYDEPRVPELSQEQYMEKEGTVASNAHTMSAEAAWDGVAQSIDLNFSHAVAYGRMQIKDLNDVTITKAIVKVDEAEYQVNLSSELDTKYIWFACDADDAIATLDIEVEASNGRSYVKTIDMTQYANPLKFRTGEVSKFAVSGLTAKPADYTLNLNKVVARTGNTITFQGDDENDTWTVIFNEGLTEIVEGVYQGVYDAAYADAWSSESALEFDSKESSFNLAVNPAQYGYYLKIDSTINVSVEDGIYTITAFWPSYIGGDKTVSISYVGDLTVVTPVVPEPDEPEGLVFTSAEWTNNWAPSDKLVKFYTEDGAVLQLNWYNCGEDNWIVPRTYGFANSGEIYYGGTYSWYEVSGAKTEVANGTVVVSVVDGQYYIEFTNLVDCDGNMVIESATFKGAISGLIVPDSRTKLATPNVTYQLEGNMLTLSWDVVDGAVGYYVYDNYHEFEETTTERSITVELTEYRVWYFYVTALAAADSTEYQDSDTYEIEFNHRDPNVFADYMTNTVTYNSSYGFQFTNNGSAPYIYVYMNENDSPGRNSFVAKPYTFDYNGNTNPITGTFDINRYSTGSGTTYGSSIYSGEMLIEIVDNEYKVTIMAGSITFGYKGVPTGWPIPGGGSTEPVDPVQLAQPALTSSNVTSDGFDVSWTAVANASSYNVSLGGATYNVNGTSHSFTGLDPETSYTVSVVAVGDGVNYTNSEAATLTVTTTAEAVTPEPGDSNVLTSAKCFGMVYDMVPNYEFRSADGQNILNVTIYQQPTRIFAYEYSFTSSINTLAGNPNKYFTSGSSYSGNCTINGVSGIVIGAGSTIKVTESLGDGAKHKIEFHIVTTGGQTYDFTFEGVIVDAR